MNKLTGREWCLPRQPDCTNVAEASAERELHWRRTAWVGPIIETCKIISSNTIQTARFVSLHKMAFFNLHRYLGLPALISTAIMAFNKVQRTHISGAIAENHTLPDTTLDAEQINAVCSTYFRRNCRTRVHDVI